MKKELFCDADCGKKEVELIWLIEYDPIPNLKPEKAPEKDKYVMVYQGTTRTPPTLPTRSLLHSKIFVSTLHGR